MPIIALGQVIEKQEYWAFYMINKLNALIEKNIKNGAEINIGQPVSFQNIEKSEILLGVQFPKSYILFLENFGTIEIDGRCFAGLKPEQVDVTGDVVSYTKYLREAEGLPDQYIALDFQDGDAMLCIDTSRLNELQEAPLVLVDPVTKESSLVSDTFMDFLIEYLG